MLCSTGLECLKTVVVSACFCPAACAAASIEFQVWDWMVDLHNSVDVAGIVDGLDGVAHQPLAW